MKPDFKVTIDTFTSPSTVIFIKADISVTSLTSHNIGCPREITIQVE